MKDKLSYSKLYDDMEERGITFNYHNKPQVVSIFERTNYYYKIASFRKNFEKIDGKYQNLDFAYLVDLAVLDMYIRNILLQISLSTEHFIKTELSRLINLNPNEDGYTLVDEYAQENPKNFKDTLGRFSRTRYQKNMYHKRSNDLSIWALMEHMDYTAFMKLTELYYRKHNSKSLKKAVDLWINSRYIRNACAHNSVFLIEWFNQLSIVKSNAATTSFANVMKIENDTAKFSKINDLISLFALLKTYATDEVIHHEYENGQSFIKRCLRNKDSYKNIPNLKNMYDIFYKLFDFLKD